MSMAEWKISDKVDVTMIFFKQIDRINIIMSEQNFDLMQLARAVDALESNVMFLKLKRNKTEKSKKAEKSESAVIKLKTKKMSAGEMYELAREKLSEAFILLDSEEMLTKNIYEASG